MGLSAEVAAELRDRMVAALTAAASGNAAVGDDVDEQYGGEMWARCEALTAGAVLLGFMCKSTSTAAVSVSRLRTRPLRITGNLAALKFTWQCYKASCKNHRWFANVIIHKNVSLNFYVTLHIRLAPCPGARRPSG